MTHHDSTTKTQQNAATSAEAHGWVAVGDALPEMGVAVLAVLERKVTIMVRNKSQGEEGKWGWFRVSGGLGFHPSWVSHWMRLPQPPNDQALP